MNILFYTVASKRSRDVESQAIAFSKKGHTVSLLTQSPRSELHDFFESRNFKTDSKVFKSVFLPNWIFIHTVFLIKYCRKNNIDLVYSHLDPCNLIAAVAQHFTKIKFVVCRHHADALEFETNKKGRWISKMIYRLAKTIIVVSANSKRYMVDVEKIRADKIWVIPNSYDFNLYKLPSTDSVERLRMKYTASLLLVTIGRLTSLKRIHLIVSLMDKLTARAVDAKLMIVGVGPEEQSLRSMVATLGLTERIFFEGFQTDVLKYLQAADLYVHFSETEASCTTVKEAGLVAKPVVVCRGVGDFDEYVQHKENGWVVDKSNCVEETERLICEDLKNKNVLHEMGRKLNDTIRKKFDIEKMVDKYEAIQKQLLEN
jgi:glycosyltransferase involved in cell wall biosynthesis